MKLSDAEVLDGIQTCLRIERQALAKLLTFLIEADRRQLYAKQGYPSLYAYMVECLHLSEGSAWRRIQVARAARDFPEILSAVENGKLHLTGLAVLVPVLTRENSSQLLITASGKSKREIERLISELSPEMIETPREYVRRLPKNAPAETESDLESKCTFPGGGDRIPDSTGTTKDPMNPRVSTESAISNFNFQDANRRVSIHFLADEHFLSCLDRARALMKHKFPEGRLQDVFYEALRLYLEKRDPELKLPSPEFAHPTSASRYIPARTKAQIWKRDGGRCTYVSKERKRCEAREGLEFDHIIPWAKGGRSTYSNLRLLCRAHNQYAAKTEFGERWMNAKVGEIRR